MPPNLSIATKECYYPRFAGTGGRETPETIECVTIGDVPEGVGEETGAFLEEFTNRAYNGNPGLLAPLVPGYRVEIPLLPQSVFEDNKSGHLHQPALFSPALLRGRVRD